jgi:nitronate monooxygenase
MPQPAAAGYGGAEAMAHDPLHTPLCDRLGIGLPILGAPMAGGAGTPELAAAVTRAGGLGLLGVTGTTADVTRAAVRRALELSRGGPVGVNVQLAPPEPGPGDPAAWREHLAPLRAELGLPADPPPPPRPDPPLALVEAALEAGATVVSAALGDPAPLAPLARAARAPLVAMVSTVAEARASVAAGADVVVAQGAEAGGHRTTFALGPDGPPLVGTLALVPLVADAVDVPVVAAGGIMDGRGLAAALALGAQGVLCGTLLLTAAEAGTSPAYREAVLGLPETATFVSDAVTGRPARWIRNRLTTALADGPATLGWPGQRFVSADIAQAAAWAGEGELLPMLAGQAAALARGERPAQELVAGMAEHARAVLARLGGRGP